jgi:hypothetical protein
MMRPEAHGIYIAFLLALVTLSSSAESAEDDEKRLRRFWLGAEVGFSFLRDGDGVAGDAQEYLSAMGADVDASRDGLSSTIAGFSEGYRLSSWFAFELNTRFFWAGLDAPFRGNPGLGYAINRFIIPITVLGRIGPDLDGAHLSVGVGPSVVIVRTTESGHFGDSESWSVRPGVSGSVACYVDVGFGMMLGADVVLSYLPLPRTCPTGPVLVLT